MLRRSWIFLYYASFSLKDVVDVENKELDVARIVTVKLSVYVNAH